MVEGVGGCVGGLWVSLSVDLCVWVRLRDSDWSKVLVLVDVDVNPKVKEREENLFVLIGHGYKKQQQQQGPRGPVSNTPSFLGRSWVLGSVGAPPRAPRYRTPRRRRTGEGNCVVFMFKVFRLPLNLPSPSVFSGPSDPFGTATGPVPKKR